MAKSTPKGECNKVKKMSRTEAIAMDMLTELFKSRNFESYLVDVVVDSLQNETGDDLIDYQKSRKNVVHKEDRLQFYSQGALSLQSMLSSVIQTFIRSLDLALCTFDTDRNRDGALIYSVSVTVRDFTSSESLSLSRFQMVVRRLSSLLSVFATRISTPFHIANNAFFASSICELLYEFESHCVSKLGQLQHFGSLRSSIDEFYTVVVKRLNEIASLRKRLSDGNNKEVFTKALPLSTPLATAFRRSKSAVSFNDRIRHSRSPNFLGMRGRNVNQKSTSKRRQDGSCGSYSCHSGLARFGAGRFLQQSAAAINEGRIGKKDCVANQLKRNAQRLAKEITEEVVEDLAQRVERACSARRK